MRQAGIVAAAGLYAIEHHRARLADDHANAKAFAEALYGAKGIAVDPAKVKTNIVMLDVVNADAIAAAVRGKGVVLSPSGTRIRVVTHLDVTREQVLAAAKAIAEAAA
jgi:threonine aldolase